MLMRVFFGPVKEPATHERVSDLTGRELAALVPLAAICIAIGVYPQPLLDAARRDVGVVADLVDRARGRATRQPGAVAVAHPSPTVAEGPARD
jgi:NADH:ubiquinone oxidoreductase subunit 4 (subunit M)